MILFLFFLFTFDEMAMRFCCFVCVRDGGAILLLCEGLKQRCDFVALFTFQMAILFSLFIFERAMRSCFSAYFPKGDAILFSLIF